MGSDVGDSAHVMPDGNGGVFIMTSKQDEKHWQDTLDDLDGKFR